MLTGVDGVEWSGVDTPQTVMTTRAPAVLKMGRQMSKNGADYVTKYGEGDVPVAHVPKPE